MARRERVRRGRLSSIDLLPEAADPLVAAAMRDLQARDKPQNIILEELNSALADLGVASISKSAFNRKAIWAASAGRRLAEAREIAAVVGERLGKLPEGDVGLLLNETLKTLILDVLTDASLSGESASIDMLRKASMALRSLEGARKISVDARSKIIREFADKADKAIETTARKAGLDAATVARIRREVLGVVEK